jgi:formylglycine-generating enzyme required for sulfatase activity
MVDVPAGEFVMGCDSESECAQAELPVRRVRLGAFRIDRTEVTAFEYGRCVAAGACRRAPSVGLCNHDQPDHLGFAANCVTWDQARAYCAWAGKRLPTEAEWEKAARGTDARTYPWGNEAPDFGGQFRANWGEGLDQAAWMRDGWEYDAPAGRFVAGASPCGAIDLAGNVAEWVADWHAQTGYDPTALADPKGPATGEDRVVRGGSFRDPARRIRTYARDGHGPDQWFEHVGFRCAWSM